MVRLSRISFLAILVDGSKYGNNIMATVADGDDDDDDVYYGQILWISLLYRTFVWNK